MSTFFDHLDDSDPERTRALAVYKPLGIDMPLRDAMDALESASGVHKVLRAAEIVADINASSGARGPTLSPYLRHELSQAVGLLIAHALDRLECVCEGAKRLQARGVA